MRQHFLAPHDLDEHQFSIVYKRAFNGHQHMEILLDYNRVILIAELLWDVYVSALNLNKQQGSRTLLHTYNHISMVLARQIAHSSVFF